jgi:hypothetical protein
VLRLDPRAPSSGTGAVYDRAADGLAHVVSLLPGDATPAAGEQAYYQGASKDGTTVAFKIGGTLYVRVPDDEDGETLKIAEAGPIFAGLSANGRYVFYVAGGEMGTIHRFDTTNEADVEINPTAEGEVVNISADGSHVYFISEFEIAGEGSAGSPNLFVWSSGVIDYIATVAPSDLERTSGELNGICASSSLCGIPALTRWTTHAVAPPGSSVEAGPGAESSRSTPDGEVLVFESRSKLTNYENAGHTEIYRWDEGDPESVACVSCGPLGEPATADARLQELKLVVAGIVLNNVSDDGSRVFFETAESLVGRDTDDVNDIYQWQKGEGTGGMVDLISSGRSVEYPPLLSFLLHAPKPNLLLSITPTGDDVLFLSQDTLVTGAGQGGTPAIYDARVGGGFPQPITPPICLEEECRGSAAAAAAPEVQRQRSEGLIGAGNVKRSRRECHHARKRSKHRRCRKHAKRHHWAKGSLVSGSATSQPQEIPRAGDGTSAPASVTAVVAEMEAQNLGPTAAAVKPKPYGIESVEARESTYAAGAHPDFTTRLVFNQYLDSEGKTRSDDHTEEISISLPPGLAGNINATPGCDTGHLIAYANCPIESQVGIVKGRVADGFDRFATPVYNLLPPHPHDEVARLGFIGELYPVFIDIKVRTAGDYGVTATVHSSPGLLPLLNAEATLWGNPTAPIHDPQRLLATEQGCPGATACFDPDGKREVPRTNRAFMVNPSACQEGSAVFAVKSYQLPGQLFTASAPLAPITDCTGLPFAPSFEAEPTSHVAGAPTGLKTKLVLPQHLGAEERAIATMREAGVTLPAGMQIAAGAANWIGTCSEEQVGFHEEVDAACPDASKLGTATITSPDLPEPIEGTLYQRDPRPGHQFGLWLTSDALGLHVKLPGELEPDKNTGRLTAVFTDLPQVPVEEIDLNVWGGPRAPLQNPDRCGTYTTDYSFFPHSQDQAVTGQSTMQIAEGCNQPFAPTLHAGVTEPVAKKFSPFVFDLTREDGSQALRGFTLHLPDGELAKLKGVPLCPDADAASGSCPAASRIGSLKAASGPGPEPLWIPQPGRPEPQIYLAGPYQGSPFSILTEVPAQAGPFDLGTLGVRSGLGVEPETGRGVVEADPLPQFFEGVGIAYRRLHAVIDRPDFSLNPTDCRAMKVASDVVSTRGTVAHPSARFKLEGCKRLKFKPRLSLKLKGGTSRGEYPALTAVLKARKGDANIERTSVSLPHSEFLAQEHIQTICTRKRFAADSCPKGSVYGRAKAWTPLLSKPLGGPVYLRSSDHPLPDLVVALGGELEIDLVGRIDSHHGGIRTTFEHVPDAPVSRFVLQMKGGTKGLLVNSQDICQGNHRAAVDIGGQNGRSQSFQALLSHPGCAGSKP